MHEGDLAEYIDEKVDFVLFGHTHNSYLKKKGRQTIINPGTLSGYVSGKSTYAIIDLTYMKSEILEL
jgi:predicted phosphodiesterase